MKFRAHTSVPRQAAILLTVLATIPAAVSQAQDKAEPAEPIALTSAQIKQRINGNSLAGNGRVKDPAPPYDWTAHYATDGTLQLKLKPEWGGTTMKGRWWITDNNQQCRKFETGHQQEGCWHFFQEGKFLRFVPSSGKAVEGRAVVLPGNALLSE